jgi:hypothetical protein
MKALIIAAAALAVTTLAGCKPPHYLVWCDNYSDSNGYWELFDVKYQDGYIISCSWLNKANNDVFTRACDRNGC